jgi:hypothetical protein
MSLIRLQTPVEYWCHELKGRIMSSDLLIVLASFAVVVTAIAAVRISRRRRRNNHVHQFVRSPGSRSGETQVIVSRGDPGGPPGMGPGAWWGMDG